MKHPHIGSMSGEAQRIVTTVLADFDKLEVAFRHMNAYKQMQRELHHAQSSLDAVARLLRLIEQDVKL